ncbi:MAG: threonine synthase [Bacteroidota bacterium]
MKFISTNGKSPAVTFREALFQGMAPDGGLYVPERLPQLSPSTLDNLQHLPLQALGRQILSSFIDEIPERDLELIIQRAWNFPLPLVQHSDAMYLLELFHGPTLAFKDVGARFMAEALSFFLVQENREITIAVATSGDTGSAVAHGFYDTPNITVYILYPSGKISRLQEQQMTTLSGNIRAVEVSGTFDDCQRLVKQALADNELRRNLTTANSINLGRLLPQIAYYAWAVAQLRGQGRQDAATVVVPSGNFGNLTAAVYAKFLGLPLEQFIAATNVNDVVPQYLETGAFTPRSSIQTLSNAIDVGNPSNLARLQFLYENSVDRMRRDMTAVRISDEETLSEIRRTYDQTRYILDPHTAVGVAAARKHLERRQSSSPIIVAATAHPAKFPEIVEQALGVQIPLPPALQEALGRPKQAVKIAPTFSEFKSLLIR